MWMDDTAGKVAIVVGDQGVQGTERMEVKENMGPQLGGGWELEAPVALRAGGLKVKKMKRFLQKEPLGQSRVKG